VVGSIILNHFSIAGFTLSHSSLSIWFSLFLRYAYTPSYELETECWHTEHYLVLLCKLLLYEDIAIIPILFLNNGYRFIILRSIVFVIRGFSSGFMNESSITITEIALLNTSYLTYTFMSEA